MKLTRREHVEHIAQPELEQLRAPKSLDTWLDVFSSMMRLAPEARESIRNELSAHLHERVRDLMLDGNSDAEAIGIATLELGEAASLARRFEQANRPSRRRLIMNVALLGLGAGAVVSGVLIAGNTGSSRSGMPSSVFNPAVVSEDPPKWMSEAGVFTFEGELLLGDVTEAFDDMLEETPLVVHWRELAEVDVTRDTVVDMRASKLSMGRALDQLVESIGEEWDCVTWRYVNEVVELGTIEGFDGRETELATYIITPIIDGLANQYGFGYEESIEEIETLLYALVSPNDWEANGGTTAQLHVVGGKMFIQAPQRMHEKVKWILAELESGEEIAGGQKLPAALGRAYVVQAGDSLAGIAREYLGSASAWEQLQRLNPNLDLDRLPVGQVIQLPPDRNLLPPANHRLPSENRQLPPANHRLPSENNQLPPANHRLPSGN